MPVGEDKFIIPRLSTLQPIEEQLGRSFPAFINPEYVSDLEGMNIKPVLSANAEMAFKCDVNAPLFKQMCGIDLALGDARVGKMTLRLESPYLVQARKHRKKRINKKWAKRYGFKYMFKVVDLEDVKIENHDGEIDILGRSVTR
jgi:hypothetical protein